MDHRPGGVRGLLAIHVALLALTGPAYADPSPKPNVVLILLDDVGWTGTELGPHPSDFHETPSLAALAAQGTTYSNAYSPAAVCSPTRGSFLSGRTPAALRETANPASLATDEITFAEAVRDADPDYRTGFFGKWHLTASGDPGIHGFEFHDGATSGQPPVSGDPANPKDMFGVAARAVQFMTDRVAEARPFVLVVSHYATHLPMETRPATLTKYAAKPPGVLHSSPLYAAMTEDLDAAVGQVLLAVSSLGIGDRTYVVVTSDNGHDYSAPTTSAPLRGTKVSLWEGGIRVPFVVSGPGIPPGATDATPIVGWDLAPSVLDWLGVDPVPAYEGEPLAALAGSPPRDLVWHYPHCFATRVYAVGPQSAIRRGDWKLIRRHPAEGPVTEELYDLASDIGESVDLAAQEPEVYAELSAALSSHLAAVDAEQVPAGLTCEVLPPKRCGLGFELALLGLLWPLVKARMRAV